MPSIYIFISRMRVPEVNKSCFCCPLRWGIIIFGYINLICSIAAVSCLVVMTDVLSAMVKRDSSLELVTSTVLFGILGMGVILNVLLLYAGAKKDVSLLRLYNFYATFNTLASLVPTLILSYKQHYIVVAGAFLAIMMQFYVIILVKSEIVKLTKQNTRVYEETTAVVEVEEPDRETLL